MAKQLHEKQQDTELDTQNKHFIETPAGAVKWITTDQLHGGLQFGAYSITRNLERGVDPTSFTNYTTSAGLGSNNVNRLYVLGNYVYAATDGGLSISTDGGITYTNYTTANGLGSNTCNDVFAVSNKVYVATSGGVSISSDYGATYTNYTTANGLFSNTCIRIFVDGSNVYVLNGRVQKSTDNGLSYSTIYTVPSGRVPSAIYANGNNIYLTTDVGANGGFYKSTDGGTSFTYISGIASGTTVGAKYNSIVIDGSNVYITLGSGTNSGLYVSADGGLNYTRYSTTDGLGSNSCNDIAIYNGQIYIATVAGLSYATIGTYVFTNYTTANGLGNNNCSRCMTLGGKLYVASDTATGGVSISASTWIRTLTGSGTVTEHDIVTSSIDDYATASGAAGSTATLTQIMRKTISLITSFLPLWVSDTTESSATTNGSLRTAGGAGIVKNLNVGGIITAYNDIMFRLQLWSRSSADETIFLLNTDDAGNASLNSNYASGGTYRETGYSNQISMNLDGNVTVSAGTGTADAGITFQEKCSIDSANSKLRLTNIRLYGALQPTEWRADTHAGYGSTDTMIPYFTNVRVNNIIGSDITVVNNATNGCKITINTAGVYAIKYSAVGESGAAYASGISVNSNQLTTGIQSITASHRVAFSRNSAVAADYDAGDNAITMWLAVNDVVRPHTSGGTPALTPQNIFSIIRIL